MKQETETQELCFKHAVIHILHYWRSMAVLGVALGILLGGYQLLRGLNSYSDNLNAYEKQAKEYQDNLSDYKNQKEQIMFDIDEKMDAAEKQTEYLKNSILMNMDASNKMQASADILVKLDKSVWENFGNAEYDPTDSLLTLYSKGIMSETDWEQIAESNNIDAKYIKELVQVDMQLNNNIISVVVSHPKKETAVDILAEVLDVVSSQTETMRTNVFNHTVSVIKGDPEKVPDKELEQLQTSAKSLLSDYNNSITNSKNDLKNLIEPTPVSSPSLIKLGIKVIINAIIGLIIGVLIIAVIRAAFYFCSSKIFSETEISEAYSIRILGNVTPKKEKKFLTCIDKFIDSFADEDTDLTPEQKEVFLIHNIKDALGSSKSLLLIGSAPKEEMDKLKDLISTKLTMLDIAIEKDIQKNIDAYDSINKNDAIIMVEKLGVSKYTDISKAKKFVETNEKQIAGCILV